MTATPATHDGAGMLRMSDDAPVFASAVAAALPPGPVLLTLAHVEPTGAYRDGSTPTVIAAASGTLESARAALASALAGAHALALLVVLVAAAPLAVAVLIGLK